MSIQVRSNRNGSRGANKSRRGTFEMLESRLALSVNLASAGAFETLGGSTNAMFSAPHDFRGGGMATDGAGNSYVTVQSIGVHTVDLNPGPGVNAVSMAAGLVKLDPNGAAVWNASFIATDVMRILPAVDANQNVYLVGDFRGTIDFDPGPGVMNVTSSQGGGAFSDYFMKLNSAGQLQWVRKIDGNGLAPDRFVLDGAGNLVIAANFGPGTSAPPMDVDPGSGQFLVQQKAVNGGADLLVLKYSTNGDFIWARQLGGVDADMTSSISSLAVDGQGDVYIGRGFKGSLDLDPGAGVHMATNSDDATDGFVVRLNSGGNFQWAYVTEGYGGAQFRDIDIASDGSIVVSGYLKGTVDFQPGAGNVSLTYGGGTTESDGLVLKLNSDATLAWVRKFVGVGETTAYEVEVDQAGNVYLGGSFGRLGTPGQVSDFDPGPGDYELIMPSGQETGFVLSLTGGGDFRWAAPIGGNTGRAQVQDLSVTAGGDVRISGEFKGSADFDPNPETETWLNSGTTQSVFVATLSQVAPDPGAPVVDAGASQTILITGSASLHGVVADDGVPNPLTTAWSFFSGPGSVTFGNASALDTTAAFSTIGSYVLKLQATDGQFTTADYVHIIVNPVTTSLTATADTFIDGGNATTNYGTSATLTVSGKPDDASLLRWDLSSIPAGSTLQSATLTINVTNTSVNSYDIYELKRSWTESQATWKKAISTTNWQSAGADGALDRGTTVLGTVSPVPYDPTATGLRTVTLNAAGLAVLQGWINNPTTNFGFAIQNYANANKDDLIFSSKESTVVANRPQLQVVYTPPSPPPMSQAKSQVASKSALTATPSANTAASSATRAQILATPAPASDSHTSDTLNILSRAVSAAVPSVSNPNSRSSDGADNAASHDAALSATDYSKWPQIVDEILSTI